MAGDAEDAGSVGAVVNDEQHRTPKAESGPIALRLLKAIVCVFYLFLAVALFGIAGALFVASQVQDKTAIAASEKLLAAVLDVEQRGLSRLAKDYTNWDDSIRNLLVDFDEKWADKNIGPYLSKTFDTTASVVVDGRNGPIFAFADGKIIRGFEYSSFGPGMTELLRRARAHAGKKEPPAFSGYVLRDGYIEIVATSVFAREYPDKSPPLTDPTAALILTKRLDAKALGELAGDFDLPGLRLLKLGERRSSPILPLADPHAREIGRLTWRPALPGRHILHNVLPQIVLGFAAIAGLAVLFLAWARKLTRRIVFDSERLARNNSELAESEQKLSRAMVLAHAGTWEWQIDRDRHVWSEAVYRLFGIAPGTPVTFSAIAERIHPDDRQYFSAQSLKWRNTPGSHRCEFRVAHPDGHVRDVRLYSESLPDEFDRVSRFCSLVQDATEQKRLDLELREMEKTEALRHLTGGVAHELNNLLQIVVANAELCEIAFATGKHPTENLRTVFHACDSGRNLTEQLLTYAGRRVVAPAIVDATAFVEEAAPLFRQLVGGTIFVEAKPAANVWSISADPAELQAALVNLVVNARDAMPKGGSIAIETANVHLDRKFSSSRPYDVRVGDYVAIAVRDTGTGMTPDVLRHAFEPFFTTKDVGKGTGLGLSMVFGFMHRQCGGYIDIESHVGKGTTVRLYFPRAHALAGERAKGGSAPRRA